MNCCGSKEFEMFNYKSGYKLTVKCTYSDTEFKVSVISKDNNTDINYYMTIPEGKNTVDIVVEIIYEYILQNYDITTLTSWFKDWILNSILEDCETEIRDCIINAFVKFERNGGEKK